jgi:hypothetical protein
MSHLSGALGTLYVFYDLSQRFTVRAQAGQQSAVDLIFTVPYDEGGFGAGPHSPPNTIPLLQETCRHSSMDRTSAS